MFYGSYTQSDGKVRTGTRSASTRHGRRRARDRIVAVTSEKPAQNNAATSKPRTFAVSKSLVTHIEPMPCGPTQDRSKIRDVNREESPEADIVPHPGSDGGPF
jgi:hypothetical protein